MFENLKAFIRHGKNAENLSFSDLNNMNIDKHTLAKVTTNELPDLIQNQPHSVPNVHQQTQIVEPTESYKSTESKNERNYDNYASQIVEQENLIKKQKIKYPNLDNYHVLEQLGEGAFSIVYKAQHLKSGKFVAIKILRKFQMDNAQKQAVLKEVTIMRQLKHPNIVEFIEFIDSEPYYYIVQELVSGGEIFLAIVKYTYLSEDLSRHIIVQVANSIRYLHEEVGIVHRDIKPENLLYFPIDFKPSSNPSSKLRRSDDPSKLDEGEFTQGLGGGTIGLVKVADFGLSKQIWEHNTKTPCGTVGYTAPEIVRDERYSKEVDMWAIGCVLYTLLCGFPPFYDERIDILTEKVAKGEYTFLSPWWDEISKEAKYCVSRLLTVDPSKRYTIEEFLKDPWINNSSAMGPPRMKSSRSIQAHHPIQMNNQLPQNQSKYKKKYGNELYSPAAVALRDAFDISTAVHRNAEESKLSNIQFDQLIEEEEEDVDNAGHVIETHHKTLPKIPKKDKPLNGNGFDLNLGGASIIERRRNKAVAVRS